MIYIVFGLSGPLKRLLIDPIVQNYCKMEADYMINVKATDKARGTEEYDRQEIVLKDVDDIKKEYDSRYIYNLREKIPCAVNKKQIERSLAAGCDHFIICHDYNVINAIIKDFEKDGVKIFSVSFSDNKLRRFVKFCETTYNSSAKTDLEARVDERVHKVSVSFDKITENKSISIIPEKIVLTYPSDEKEIPNLLWNEIKERIATNAKKYNWLQLLNSGRRSGKVDIEIEDIGDNRFVIPFQNDYDRIISSSAFRRLQDKAQVFPLERYDYVRTRLTHSIECATIVEKIGILSESVIQEKLRKNLEGVVYKPVFELKVIPTVLKTAALLHDIGNPPFGHFGEDVIRDWVKNKFPLLGIDEQKDDRKDKRKNKILKNMDWEDKRSFKNILEESGHYYDDLLNYEGNAQALRIITNLCIFEAKFGYDLTYATMGVILKYPTNSKEIDEKYVEKKKMGYFKSEEEIFYDVKRNLGLRGRHPLTYLLEAADDISYLASDLQDAHRKGLISLRTIIDELNSNWLSKINKEKTRGINDAVAKQTKSLIIDKINNLSAEYRDLGIDEEPYIIEQLHHFIKDELILRAVNSFEKNYDKIMEAKHNEELLNGDSGAKFINLFIRNQILEKYVYIDANIMRSAVKATAIANKLLDTYVPACLEKVFFEKLSVTNDRIYRLLSENYKLRFENIMKTKNKDRPDDRREMIYAAILLALDSVCGMTDSYAEYMYKMIIACD